uniref:Fatty acyl-CoA reductase n=1 Tax=Glossina morsitans morsitans TaxID=37546 RepID=A0A1B0G9J6_GLOMM
MYIEDALIDEKLTELQNFYYGQNILITGGTGFLGKILLNKLFTACPGIDQIYMLVRQKKNSNVTKRLEEIFNDPIFDTMKMMKPKFRHHIISIPGDCMLPDLGLSPEDRRILIENVNIVFHMAATVRFDEKLKIAMQINAAAARDIMLLCNEMKNLKSCLHISTAYSYCPQARIEEKFYAAPGNTKNLILLTECTPDKLLDSMTQMQISLHAVISTYNEPVSGWIDNFYGPTGVIAGAATGIIRTVRCRPHGFADMVPVDMCVNSIIAASWDIAKKYNSTITLKENGEKLTLTPKVYNFCSSKENKITWGDFTNKTANYGTMYPTTKAIWYICYANRPNRIMHLLSIFCLHYLPATILDCFSLIIGKKPRLLKTYKKIHRFMHVIEYFAMRQWDFGIDNVRDLWNSLSERDKELFFFDMNQLDWDRFLQQYILGVRRYLLKDPIETMPEALSRWNRLYWMHQIAKFAVFIVLAQIAFFIFLKIF